MNPEKVFRLQQDLHRIEAEIAAHPLASEQVRRSNEIIERIGSDHVDEISAELAKNGLPRLDQLGKIQLRHGLSFGLLHKKRIKTENKLNRITKIGPEHARSGDNLTQC